MAFTLELEQSLQAIDASVAVPLLGDYDVRMRARTTSPLDNFRASRIAFDARAGSAARRRRQFVQDHAISAGRWGYTRIARVAEERRRRRGRRAAHVRLVGDPQFGEMRA